MDSVARPCLSTNAMAVSMIRSRVSVGRSGSSKPACCPWPTSCSPLMRASSERQDPHSTSRTTGTRFGCRPRGKTYAVSPLPLEGEQSVLDDIGSALRDGLSLVFTFVPKLLLFFVILLIGWLIAKALCKGVNA